MPEEKDGMRKAVAEVESNLFWGMATEAAEDAGVQAEYDNAMAKVIDAIHDAIMVAVREVAERHGVDADQLAREAEGAIDTVAGSILDRAMQYKL